MKLNSDTYFSPEAQRKYMSASQYKAFLKCPAAALAEIRGEWKRADTQSLALGSYVDALLFNEAEWMDRHEAEIHTKKGELRAEFRAAENAAMRAYADPMFRRYVSGQAQVIRTGEISGVPFRIKMDSYHPGRAIVDLKYMRDFSSMYSPTEGRRVNFAYYWGYDIQGAIYQAIEGGNLPFFIAGITKQTPADFAIFAINQQRLNDKLREIEALAPSFQRMKDGEEEAPHCGHCEYCRTVKKLNRILDVEDVYE